MGRHRKLSIVTVILAMVAAVFATAAIAEEPFYVDRGVLLLHTSDSGYKVQWFDVPVSLAGPATATQNINIDSKCNVTLSGASLISLTPTGGNGKVGAVSNGLGVKTKNNCSTDQGQIVIGQTLKVELASDFNNTYSIGSAELDIEGKHDAKLGVAFPVGPAQVLMLGNTSDNGPDSGIGDNNVITITPAHPVRSMTLYPVANGNGGPAVSLEGGGDGVLAGGVRRTALNTNASLFSLVQEFDGVLDCGQSTPPEGGGADAAITVFRGGQTECQLKPYNDDASGSTASFEPIGQAGAEFTATIVWPAEGAVLPVPGTTIDFGNGPEAVQWCQGTAVRNTDGTLTVDAAAPYAFSGPPTLPGTASWCLLDQNVSYINGNQIQVTEYYYGSGDPFFAR